MRHRFHALCPYFAMFPEAFVEKWIERVTRPSDVVLDPFCGRGTTPFQALLMNRRAVASDVNPVAYCVTRAKTNAPTGSAVRRRITELEHEFEAARWENDRRRLPEFFQHGYAPATLRQLLYLRSRLQWRRLDADCMIAALILGSLHGETQRSQSYLSNQMPRTISTKPAYSVRFWRKHGFRPPKRDVFALLRSRLAFRYESERTPLRAVVHQADMRDLPRMLHGYGVPIRCVITSPPYLDVTKFEEDQWLRLWFLGGQARPTYGVVSKDDRHESAKRYWDLISDTWRVLGCVLAPKANIIIRIGGKKFDTEEMGLRLKATSVFSGRRTSLVHSEASELRRKQTDSFRPGSKGCLIEADFHFRLT